MFSKLNLLSQNTMRRACREAKKYLEAASLVSDGDGHTKEGRRLYTKAAYLYLKGGKPGKLLRGKLKKQLLATAAARKRWDTEERKQKVQEALVAGLPLAVSEEGISLEELAKIPALCGYPCSEAGLFLVVPEDHNKAAYLCVRLAVNKSLIQSGLANVAAFIAAPTVQEAQVHFVAHTHPPLPQITPGKDELRADHEEVKKTEAQKYEAVRRNSGTTLFYNAEKCLNGTSTEAGTRGKFNNSLVFQLPLKPQNKASFTDEGQAQFDALIAEQEAQKEQIAQEIRDLHQRFSTENITLAIVEELRALDGKMKMLEQNYDLKALKSHLVSNVSDDDCLLFSQ